METSAAGLAAIEAREGKRTVAYLDTAGVATIGVGHTGRMAPPAVHLGMTCTHEEIDAWLRADLVPVEAAIIALGVKLTQNQFDACASLAFNIGVHGFAASTVAKKMRAGDMPAAADAFLMWNKPAVLKARREGERRQFMTPDKHVVPIAASAPGVIASSSAQVVAKPDTSPLGHSESSSGVTTPLSPPAPGRAKPAPAPAAAAPAHSPAAAKAPTMTETSTNALAAAHPHVAAALPGVDLLAGIENFGKNIVAQLTAGAKAISNPAIPSVTGRPGSSNFFGTLENVKAAAGKVGEIIADAKAKDVREGVADGVDLAKIIFATLDTYKIDVPVLSTVVENLPDLHVAKAA